jgi:membrane-associated protease RseP (regulator of RpoE activity)
VNELPAGPGPGTGLPSDDSTADYPTWQQRPRYRDRYWLHILLFLMTLATTTFVGAGFYAGYEESAGLEPAWWTVAFWLKGLWYSAPVLMILAAHEFGHYIFCRVHDVDATLPFFIPAPPVFLAGTFGAVIRIRETFPSKKALFDIGVAGPIAGFVMLLPFLFWGVSQSTVAEIPQSEGALYFGEPLLYQATAWLHFGSIPEGHDVYLHPTAFAAWWGMLATALNLLPFGQLDGGHVVYALVKRQRHTAYVSIGTLAIAGGLAIVSLSWISMLVMMTIMALVFGLQHPRVFDEDTPLDRGRRWIAFFALVIFALCFTPVPIRLFLPQ